MKRKIIELKNLNEKLKGLEKCKELVLNDMRNESNCLIKDWDGEPCNVTPENHFDNIVNWCKNNIYSTIWSHRSSSKMPFNTSYGAKHRCEKMLKCYVANNWMKCAMILAGMEVAHIRDVDYETGRVYKNPIRLSDIITNSENFIVRLPRKKVNLDKMINNYSYELKYNSGGYEE